MDKWTLIFGLIGVASLALAVPLAIVANMLTPIFQTWWGNRNVDAKRKRYEAIQRELEEGLNKEDLWAEGIRKVIYGLGYLIFGLMYSFFFIAFFILRTVAPLSKVPVPNISYGMIDS